MTDAHNNDASVHAEWCAEFDAAAARPFELHMKYAFIHTYKPVLDDAPYRSFETTEAYRQWCNRHLPKLNNQGQALQTLIARTRG